MRRDILEKLIIFFLAACLWGLTLELRVPVTTLLSKIFYFGAPNPLVVWMDMAPAETGTGKAPKAVSRGPIASEEFKEGQRLKKVGLHEHAARLFESVLRQREAVLEETDPELARCLEELGEVYSLQGYHAVAEPLLTRAVAISEVAPGEYQLNLAGSLTRLGDAYRAQGLYVRAEPLYARALSILMEVQDRELQRWRDVDSLLLGEGVDGLVGKLVKTLSELYRDMGQYDQAENTLVKALSHGPDRDVYSLRALRELASLYRQLEQYTRAERLYQRMIERLENLHGKDDLSVADSLGALAGLYRDMGRHELAATLYHRSLSIREKRHGAHHADVAASLHQLANLHRDMRRYGQALPLYTSALSIREEVLGSNHVDVAATLNDFANLYRDMERYEQALPLYERALSIRQMRLGTQHVDVAASLSDLAQLHLARQQLDKALPLLSQAFTLSEKHLRQEAFSFSEGRLASMLKRFRVEEERLYRLARAWPEHPGVQRLALSAALLRKGRSVEALANASRLLNASRNHPAFERLRALRTQRATLSWSGPGELPVDDYQQRLKGLADEIDALEAELGGRFEPYYSDASSRVLLAPAGLIEKVAKLLPRDGALIEFVAYHDSPSSSAPGAPPSDASSQLYYLALLLFPDGRISIIDLGLAGPIELAAQRLQEALAQRAGAYRHAAQEAYARVFAPLVPLLRKVRQLFIVPDGRLALVPFAALHDGRRFLVDGFDIVYLNSGKDILLSTEPTVTEASVVVLADPDFNSEYGEPSAEDSRGLTGRTAALTRFLSAFRSDLPDQPWTPLPGTRKEAESIRKMFPQARILLGSSATKDALLQLSTPGVLHIATHGFFLSDDYTPPASRAVKHFGVLAEAGPAQLPVDPLLRSGLVLAGAQASSLKPGSLRRENSLVTALELAGLNLWGTQLVVLSACDTGRGDVRLGQGVYGLRRALMVAGAETLVTSLWKVDDEATHQFMSHYYRNLLAGQSRIAALRETMLTQRRKQPHPHYWAPFIGIGRDVPLSGLEQRSASSTR